MSDFTENIDEIIEEQRGVLDRLGEVENNE